MQDKPLLVVALALVLAHVYFGFALRNPLFPEVAPPLVPRLLYSICLTAVGLVAGANLDRDPMMAADLAMVAMGFLAGPAIAPPPRVLERGIVDRLRATAEGLFVAAIVKKTVALGLFLACSALSVTYWWGAVSGLVLLLLQINVFALASADAPGPEGPTWRAVARWQIQFVGAAVCFFTLQTFYVHIVLASTNYAPLGWSAFAGLGWWALLTLLLGVLLR